jgi:UDP-glucose 4-epimerase
MLRRPLVTGAGGFIGSHLALELSKNSEVEFVYVIDLPGSPRLEAFRNNSKIRILEIDLSSPDAKIRLPDDPTVVFALAALNGTARFYTQPHTVLVNSTVPTLSIIEKYIPGIPVVYSSSSEVYASTISLLDWAVPTDEKVPISLENLHNPRWSYATAKLFGEIALISAAREFGGSGAIVRYHNVYGPNMGHDHFVPDFIARCKTGKKTLTGAEQTRAFLYIDDAVKGTIASVQKVSPEVPIFHLGSDEELKIIEAAKIILSAMDLDHTDITHSEAPEGSVSRRCADSSKAKSELGWKAVTSFAEGIAKVLYSK